MRVRGFARRLNVTKLGLGTSQFGNPYRETFDEQETSAFDAVWSAGTRNFGAAPHYGRGLSERKLGDPPQQRRCDYFLVSARVDRPLEPSLETADQPDDSEFLVTAATTRRWAFSGITHRGGQFLQPSTIED